MKKEHRQQNYHPPTSHHGPGGLPMAQAPTSNFQPGAEDAKTGTHPGLSTRGDGSQHRNEGFHLTVVFLYYIHLYA